MRLVRVLFIFENNTGHTDRRTDGRTDGRTDRRTDGRTDTPSYRDAMAHLKIAVETEKQKKENRKKEKTGNIKIFFIHGWH